MKENFIIIFQDFLRTKKRINGGLCDSYQISYAEISYSISSVLWTKIYQSIALCIAGLTSMEICGLFILGKVQRVSSINIVETVSVSKLKNKVLFGGPLIIQQQKVWNKTIMCRLNNTKLIYIKGVRNTRGHQQYSGWSLWLLSLAHLVIKIIEQVKNLPKTLERQTSAEI